MILKYGEYLDWTFIDDIRKVQVVKRSNGEYADGNIEINVWRGENPIGTVMTFDRFMDAYLMSDEGKTVERLI